MCWAARNAVFQKEKKKTVKSRQLSEPCDFGEGVRGASLRKNMKWKIKKRNCVVWEDNVKGGRFRQENIFKTGKPHMEILAVKSEKNS